MTEADDLARTIRGYLKDLESKGFQYPLSGAFVSRNGGFFFIRYIKRADGRIDSEPTSAPSSDMEMQRPIFGLFVDARGSAAAFEMVSGAEALFRSAPTGQIN